MPCTRVVLTGNCFFDAAQRRENWAPPKITFRSWVDPSSAVAATEGGCGSSVFSSCVVPPFAGRRVDGVAGFIAALSGCVFLTVNLPLLIGSRSFLVLIFAFPIRVGSRLRLVFINWTDRRLRPATPPSATTERMIEMSVFMVFMVRGIRNAIGNKAPSRSREEAPPLSLPVGWLLTWTAPLMV